MSAPGWPRAADSCILGPVSVSREIPPHAVATRVSEVSWSARASSVRASSLRASSVRAPFARSMLGRAPMLLGSLLAVSLVPAGPSSPEVARAQPRFGAAAPLRQAPVGVPVRIEHPELLAAFHASLRALGRDPSRRVRVLHYGDSNVAGDMWTDVARRELSRRFGSGGSGYLLPRGHGSWHRGLVSVRAEGLWRARRRGFGRDFGPADGLWGLAGVSVEPQAGAGLVIDVPSAAEPRVLELHLLGRRSPGGAVSVTIDDGPPERVDTRREDGALILRRWILDARAHRVRMRHAGGRPRVLGVVVERTSGVIYDVLGINGHRASAILHWNQPLLEAQLAERPPNLVVLSYGGNEALDPGLPLAAYEAQMRAAVARMRSLTPGASCLLIGPLATYPEHASRMAAVTDIQRRAAPELGCAFWDASGVSGGHGRLRRWARHPDMVSGDHLHLGPRGYATVGQAFVTSLLDGL